VPDFFCRQLRSLEAAAKSPIYEICGELNNTAALETFRSFKAEGGLRQQATRSIDEGNAPFLLLRLARVWLIVLGVRPLLVPCSSDKAG
jgi:hypothetical protein